VPECEVDPGGRTGSPAVAATRVEVVVTNAANGVKQPVSANVEGYYTVPLLPPGEYQLRTSKEGFRPASRAGIMLKVDQVARIDIVLELGSVTDTVAVIATTPVVEPEGGALGTIISCSYARRYLL
jgi:hypothetical protein